VKSACPVAAARTAATSATRTADPRAGATRLRFYLKTHLPHDVLPDGTFIMNRLIEPDQAQSTPLHVIVNWTTLLPR
jgi:hypothetical protein